MRPVSKYLVVALALFAIAFASSSVSANQALSGSFTLSHATQWKNTLLPAGEYRFRLAHRDTDTKLLVVEGSKHTLDILISPQSECNSCKTGLLRLDSQSGNPVVTSMDLPGYHLNFDSSHPAQNKGLQLGKTPKPSDQVAIHVDSN
jgi:hypothetical protein